MNSLKSVNDIFGELYNRAIQNFRAILKVLHYIKCFDNNKMDSKVSDNTIQEAVNFSKRYLNFDMLIKELNGIKNDEIQDIKLQKIINYIDINSNKLPIKIRDIQRGVSLSNMKVNDIKAMIVNYYEIDDKKSLVTKKKL